MVRYVSIADVEKRVAALWAAHGLKPRFDVERLLDALDLGLLWISIPPSSGFTVVAELVPVHRKLCVNEDLLALFEKNPPLLRFTLAHEIGHWLLHAAIISAGSINEQRATAAGLTCRRSDLDPPSGPPFPSMRLEYQANLFASHLLAPTGELAARVQRYGCEGWSPIYRLAKELGISPSAACVRLEKDGLAHRDEYGVPHPGPPPQILQRSLGL